MWTHPSFVGMDMTMNILALDPLTALHLEHGRAVGAREILEWFAEGTEPRCAQVLARWNVDEVLGQIEGTLMERLDLQEAVYDRLEEMLERPAEAGVAIDILRASTSPQARHLLALHFHEPRRITA